MQRNRSLCTTLCKIIVDSCYSDTPYQSKYFFVCLCSADVKLMARVLLRDVPKGLLDLSWLLQSFPLDQGFSTSALLICGPNNSLLGRLSCAF